MVRVGVGHAGKLANVGQILSIKDKAAYAKLARLARLREPYDDAVTATDDSDNSSSPPTSVLATSQLPMPVRLGFEV
jgi:hypothetical protein